MLHERRLRLTRVDQWPDPFEGSVPKQQIDDQVAIFGGSQAAELMFAVMPQHYPDMRALVGRMRDPWELMTKQRLAMVRAAHAICWRAGTESEAMWRLYCRGDGPDGQGLALRSTLGRLEASVALHDLYVSPIRYRLYHEGPAFNDEIDPFMHKRQGFEHEQEVRLVHFDARHFRSANGALSAEEEEPPPPDLPVYMHLDWSLADVIEMIDVSPYASQDYEERARREITAVDPSVGSRFELSVLSERRYAPNF
jgi:hypothetical protein